MTINPKDITPGRIVTVRGRIMSGGSSSGNVPVSFDTIGQSHGRTPTVYVAPSEILSVEPRPFKVGDRVRVDGTDTHTAVILALAGDDAWLQWPADDDRTVEKRSDLKHG